MGRDRTEYWPLAPSPLEDSSADLDLKHPQRAKVSRRWLWIVSLICFLQGIVILAQWLAIAALFNSEKFLEPRLLYCTSANLSQLQHHSDSERVPRAAPAYKMVEPQIKVFTVGRKLTGLTRWQGSSPETDAAWQELYDSERHIWIEDGWNVDGRHF